MSSRPDFYHTSIVTPTVLQVARRHFGCEAMDGVYLEDEGGPGSKGSHWETRIFFRAAMKAASGKGTQVVEPTLAFFEDTGWYRANYSAIGFQCVRTTLARSGSNTGPTAPPINPPRVHGVRAWH